MAGAIGGIGSAIGGIAGLFGGGDTTWHPSKSQMNTAGNSYLGNLQAVQPYALNYASYAGPNVQSTVGGYVNNPYAGGAQSAANTAGAYSSGAVAPMQMGGASSLYGLGQNAAGNANSILQAAFDPQNALYARNYQQVIDQQNAINAQNGVAGTPYGAGLTGQVGSNFNLDWQNNALNRMVTGAQGYGQMVNTAGKGYTGASDLGTGAVSSLYGGGQIPYSQYTGNLGQILTALGGGGSALSSAFSPVSDINSQYGSYLGIGQNGQNAAFGQNQTLGTNLGYGLAQLQNSSLGSQLSQLFGGGSAAPVNVTPSVYGYY